MGNHLSSEEMVAFCTSLEIDATDVAQFFSILSAGGNRSVDVETFVIGCIKLKGFAKSMDLMDLTIRLKNYFQDIRMNMWEALDKLESVGDNLQSYHRANLQANAGSRVVANSTCSTHS